MKMMIKARKAMMGMCGRREREMRAMGESLAVGRVVVVVWLPLWEGLGSEGEGKGEDIESSSGVVVVVIVVVRLAIDEKSVKYKRERLCSHFENISEQRRCKCYAE